MDDGHLEIPTRIVLDVRAELGYAIRLMDRSLPDSGIEVRRN
jgi:hypothetical protein